MRGHTLPEMLAVLTLLAVGASTLVPPARRLADLTAVAAAREELIGLLHDARAAALSSGGSRIVIVGSPPEARIEAANRPGPGRRIAAGNGVTLDIGAADSTALRFDALGIGRFASRTFVLRRGDARASVVVSSYGRIRRR